MSGKVEGQPGEPDLQRVMELLEYSIPKSNTDEQPTRKLLCLHNKKKKNLGWAVRRLKMITPMRSNNLFPSFIPEQVFRPGIHRLRESLCPQEKGPYNNTQQLFPQSFPRVTQVIEY